MVGIHATRRNYVFNFRDRTLGRVPHILDFKMWAFAKRTAFLILTQTSQKRDLWRGTHKASRYLSIFKLILNWFLLSNELIVFTALFLPSLSAQIS
jgi:hypothetical protein